MANSAADGWRRVRVVSWNIGLRGLTKTLATVPGGTLEALLRMLDADILALQETKSQRADLTEASALAAGYSSFFSFNRALQPYCGVATIVSRAIPVLECSEGLTGALSGTASAAVASAAAAAAAATAASAVRAAPALSYTDNDTLGLSSGSGSRRVYTALELDSEGRCLVSDHGAFILFNCYAPNASSEERNEYKYQWHAALRRAVYGRLLGGRHVVIVGDLNVSHKPVDHCDPAEWSKRHGGRPFAAALFRRWMDAMLAGGQAEVSQEGDAISASNGIVLDPATAFHVSPSPSLSPSLSLSASAAAAASASSAPTVPGSAGAAATSDPALSAAGGNAGSRFVDAFRHFHGSVGGRYTCWNTQTSARETNYGTRIDYCLCDNGLLPTTTSSSSSSSSDSAGAGAGAGASAVVIGSDVHGDVKGSDHCPVSVTLRIAAPLLAQGLAMQPHPHAAAAEALPEFAKKQAKLASFFSSTGSATATAAASGSGSGGASSSTSIGGSASSNVAPTASDAAQASATVSGHKRGREERQTGSSSASTGGTEVPKGKKSRSGSSGGGGGGGARSTPMLTAFFSRTTTSTINSSSVVQQQQQKQLKLAQDVEVEVEVEEKEDEEVEVEVEVVTSGARHSGHSGHSQQGIEGAGAALPPATSSAAAPASSAAPAVWSALLRGPLPPPLCACGLPTVERTVLKEGPTMGRKFYVCTRPQGKAGDPGARCNFFRWLEEHRKLVVAAGGTAAAAAAAAVASR